MPSAERQVAFRGASLVTDTFRAHLLPSHPEGTCSASAVTQPSFRLAWQPFHFSEPRNQATPAPSRATADTGLCSSNP